MAFKVGNFVLDSAAFRYPEDYFIASQSYWEEHFSCSGSMGKRLPTVEEYISIMGRLHKLKSGSSSARGETDMPSAELYRLLRDFKSIKLCAGKLDYSKSNLLDRESGYVKNLIKDTNYRRALEDEVLKHDAKESANIVEKASGKKLFLIPPYSIDAERAIWLDIDEDRFRIGCGISIYHEYGGARGIKVS